MATIVKTPSGTWKALIRKTGWPTVAKTFRTKRDAEDWSRRTEEEMARGVYIRRSGSKKMTLEVALKRYLSEITPTKKPSTQNVLTLILERFTNDTPYDVGSYTARAGKKSVEG
jgi:hypothetical protein